MENKIKAIKFDMGSLPVDNPDELDFIEPEEFPGQFMVTRKGHKRSLEVMLINIRGDNCSTSAFRLNSSFAYWKPKMEESDLVDETVGMTRKGFNRSLENRFINKSYQEEYSNVLLSYLHYGKEEIYGKFPDYLAKKYKDRIIPLDLNHYEFYSMDKDRNIHSIGIDLKYIASKDLTKFTVLYDKNVSVKLDTNGNYSLKYLKPLPKESAKKKGNLLLEKDFTLYLDNAIPIRIYVKPLEGKI